MTEELDRSYSSLSRAKSYFYSSGVVGDCRLVVSVAVVVVLFEVEVTPTAEFRKELVECVSSSTNWSGWVDASSEDGHFSVTAETGSVIGEVPCEKRSRYIVCSAS